MVHLSVRKLPRVDEMSVVTAALTSQCVSFHKHVFTSSSWARQRHPHPPLHCLDTSFKSILDAKGLSAGGWSAAQRNSDKIPVMVIKAEGGGETVLYKKEWDQKNKTKQPTAWLQHFLLLRDYLPLAPELREYGFAQISSLMDCFSGWRKLLTFSTWKGKHGPRRVNKADLLLIIYHIYTPTFSHKRGPKVANNNVNTIKLKMHITF